ncbi:hypothetical protein MVEN_00203900 [Mycena venus]|uniref:F-box domain-containing protein n=1 Tax=Mycena venus TaxID=2733690 RepID=A0A8H7DE40_9AGAR|nr:hypothetical protein MVEN_00203900 [Mycena venus]
MNHLPSELEDVIIDFCHEDRTTLASCGLVCRGWLPASRFHLFSSITLTAENTPGFLDIISHTQTIKPLVQDVELRFSGASVLYLQVVPILLLLTRTTQLSLRPARDEVTRPVCTSSLSRALAAPSLVHLKFDFKSRFESLQQVIDCACLCPQLESLEVGGSWMRTGYFAVPPRLPRTLHTLILTCDLDNFLTWFLALENQMPPIQHLSLQHIVRREVPTVIKYLETAGPGLKSLSLAFRDTDAADQLAKEVDLSQSINLQYFHLEGSAAGIFLCLLTLLPQLRRCGIEQITVTIRGQNQPDMIRTYPWYTLDCGLSLMKRLTLLVVEPLTHVQRRDIAEGILGQLPLTRTLGIVTF